MTGPFEPKTIQVPGLLSDDAYQERLKLFSKGMATRQKSAPPPNSATEFADKIGNEFLKPGVMPGKVRNPRLQKQDEAIGVRSDILSGMAPNATGVGQQMLRNLILGPIVGPFGEGSLADKFLFDPQERQQAADERLQEAQRQEQAVRDHAETRRKLRAMTDEEAAALGLPVAPGGTRADEADAAAERDATVVQTAAENTEEKQKAVETPELQPTMPWWLNVVREGYKSAAGTPLSVAKGGIAAWELTAGRILNLGDIERSDLRAWVDTVEMTLDKMMPGDKARSRDFVTELARGSGSMMAFMVGGYVGAGIGLPAGSVPAIMGALSSGAEGLEDAELHNAVGLQKYIAFFANAALGITEAIPIDRMFLRADRATGGMVRRMIMNTTASSLEEFLQEFGQSFGHDLVAKWQYDTQREIDLSKYVRAGTVGAITGGLAGASVQVLAEAGVTDEAPTGTPVDDAAREEAAQTVIDVLQDRFDRMTAQEPADVALSAEEAASAFLDGELAGPEAAATVAPAPETFERTDERPPAFVQGPGGTIPVNENGKIELRHFSHQQLDEIDPAMRGTGPLRGKERDRLGSAIPSLPPYDEVLPRNTFSDTTTSDMAAEAGVDELAGTPGAWKEQFGPTSPLSELEIRRLHALPEAERLARLRQAVERAVDDGYVLGALPDELRGVRNGVGLGAAEASKAFSEIEALQWNATMGRTVTTAELNRMLRDAYERKRSAGSDPNVVDRAYFGAGTPPTAADIDALFADRRAAEKLPARKALKEGGWAYPKHDAERAAFRKHVEQKGYAPEGGLGDYRHIVEMDPEKVYNALEDPLRLRSKTDPELTASERLTQFEKLVKDAGFHGLYYAESELGQVVLAFEKTKPVRVESQRFDLPLDQIATPKDFEKPTSTTFTDKGGWAILTGTQERLGPPDSDLNAKQNEKLRRELARRGVEFQEVGGSYQGVDQGPSFLVFMPEREALDLASRYKQESILTRKGLEYGDGRLVPALPDQTVIGPKAKELDFFSTLPSGEAFSVGLDFAGTVEDMLAMAGTSAARGPYKAEQSRPGQGIPTPAGQQAATVETTDLSLNRITQNLAKIMDLTLRQGRISMTARDSFGNKQQVMGEYNRRQAVTRVRSKSDLSTAVHEAGHALYFGASTPLKQFITGNDTKLMKAATDLYGGDTNIMPKAVQIAEGFAEFFRVYVLNRKYAQRTYPDLTDQFDQLLTTHDKKLKDGLELIAQQYLAYLQMPSAKVISNMIVTGRRDGKIDTAMKELQEVGFKTWFHEYARGTVEHMFNRFAPLDDLVTQINNIANKNIGKALDLKRADDPRVLIRLAQNFGARAHVQLTDGVMGYRSVASETRGLRDALLLSQGKRVDQNLGRIDPVRQQDFATYLVALRLIDEFRRLDEGKIDRPPVDDATLGDAKLAVDEMQAKYPEFVEAAKIVHEYGMALWKKAHDAGLMSDETYQDGLDRRFYAPLQRDMSDKRANYGDGPLTGGQRFVKRFRGSGRDILDPMDILMHKTFALEQVIARNDVMKTLASLADKAGKAGALVERVPATKMIGTQLSVRDAARQLLSDDRIGEADAADLMLILEASIKDDRQLVAFRASQASAMGDNMVFFWENGRLAALQLADGDLGADIVNVVNGLGRENLPLFADLIAATSTAFRSSITLWPDFLVVNFIHDQLQAFILTDVGFKPFWTGLKGVGDELRQRNWAKQYNAAMGMMGGMNTAALHEARVKRDINALRKKGYVASVFKADGVLDGIRNVARVTELAETGSRLGIFRNAYERAKADGLNDWEASIEASYMATDYMNFGLNGSKMLLFRRTIPFLNAQMQGFYKMMRTLGADEVRQRKGLRFVLGAYFKSTKNMDLSRTEKQALNTGRKAWIKMASLGLISAALHFLFEDDPDYQEAGEYLRTTGWVIPLGDGRLFYIPKPFELAVLANFTERAFEYAGGDSTAKTRFLRGLAMTMVPPTAPPALQSVVEYAANKDFFSGREIVPSYMQALSPELQFNNYTTAFAKQIGEITGWSPMVVDHFMSSLGASAYRDITNVYNALDPNRPEMDATDAPLTRRFVRDVRRGSASSQDFWAQASTLNGTLRTAELSYRRYLEAGNEPAANAFLDTLSEDEKAYALLNANFEAEYKRLNPFYRTRQITTIVSALRRELVSELGVDDTTVKNSRETIQLSRRQKNEIDTALSEYARREMRNTLIAMGQPGWTNKRPLRADTTLDVIEAIDPRIREELDRRIAKAKVYSADIVHEYWPEVKNRLISDRENTFLDDVLTIAKVSR